MTKKKRASLQDIIRKRQQEEFVGRSEQIALFRMNLTRSWDDEQRIFLFNVYGQGGVGKSTLLERFKEIASDVGAVTASADEHHIDIPTVLAHFVSQLKKQGHELKRFEAHFRVYQQRREELEADPNAPKGFAAFAARTLTKATTHTIKNTIPGSGLVIDLVDEDALAAQVGDWAEYVRRRLTNKDEVQLVLRPVEILTPIFLEELGSLTEEKTAVFILDTYEQTGTYLDDWLQDVLNGRYGDVPADVVFVVSGRDELNRNNWLAFEGVISRMLLQPFTAEEMHEYLKLKGIFDRKVIDVISKLSSGLPLLIAILSIESPSNPEQIGETSGTAFERFLKWVNDPIKRQLALSAALPRYFNLDIIRVLAEQNSDDLFNWLMGTPFVHKRASDKGWKYHEVVRKQLIRQKKNESLEDWVWVHSQLASHYEQLQRKEKKSEKLNEYTVSQSHELENLYHRICAFPLDNHQSLLNEFLQIVNFEKWYISQWADTVLQAGIDLEDDGITNFGRLLSQVVSRNSLQIESAIELFTYLINSNHLEEKWHPIVFHYRGALYGLVNQYQLALEDLSKAIELDPSFTKAYVSRGIIRRLMNDYGLALENLNKAMYPEADDAIMLVLRGDTLRHLDRHAEAAMDFLRAAQKGNDTFDRKTINQLKVLSTLSAYIATSNKDLDNIRNIKLTGITAGYGLTLNTRAILTLYSNRLFSSAKPDFSLKSNFNVSPKVAIQLNQGLINRQLSKHEDALKNFTQASQHAPSNDWLLYLKGTTDLILGNKVEGQSSIEQALSIAHEGAQSASDKWDKLGNNFRVVIYELALKKPSVIRRLQGLLKKGPPPSLIQSVLQDVDDILNLFPNHLPAKRAQKILQTNLIEQSKR